MGLLDLFKSILGKLARAPVAPVDPVAPVAPVAPIALAPAPQTTQDAADPSARMPAAGMRLSAKGRAFIRQEEGCVLHAYQDSVGVWTIGVGHTGPDVYPGLVISQERADELLALDAIKHCKPINDLVTVPISQNEYDAMSSLAFNIGVGGFSGSSVLRRLNAGDRQGAADAFMMWVKPAVLVGRRRREVALFLSK